uniref:Peptidase S1 domain-containing protein n=1 Tax=Anopheles dirus TaxID=7168 RepID=A0A182NE11_9DIPT
MDFQLYIGLFPDEVQFDMSDVLNKNCGDSPYNDRFKPENGRFFENPWLVLFRHPEEQDPFCQGTIITNHHVLTTAICTETIEVNITIVVLGEYNRATDPDCSNSDECQEPRVTELLARRIIVNPKFLNDTYENDIALVTLSQRINYSNSIKPICLPLTPIIASWIHVPIAYNTLWTVEHSVPQQIKMKYIEHDTCKSQMQDMLLLHEEQICARYAIQSGSSLVGGSGSPLLVEHHDRAFQFGILSIGLPDAGFLDPFVYVNVSSHVKWIHDAIAHDLQQ